MIEQCIIGKRMLSSCPDATTLKRLHDRVALAVMIGGGLRCSEVAHLDFNHIQQRNGRWVIVDLVCKGNHVRTVSIPLWVKLAIDEWAETVDISTGFAISSQPAPATRTDERQAVIQLGVRIPIQVHW